MGFNSGFKGLIRSDSST